MNNSRFKSVIYILIIQLVICMLSGCEKKTDDIESQIAKKEGEYTIYYPGEDMDRIYSYVYETDTEDINKLTEELLGELKKGDYEGASAPVISKGLSDLSFGINSQGIILIKFPTLYQNMEGIDELLFRACVVKTLCESGRINGVEIYINDSPLIINDGKVVIRDNDDYDNEADNAQQSVYAVNSEVGIMNQYDFVNNISNKETDEQKDILTLYYADQNGRRLETVFVSVTYNDKISREELVVKKLIDGPVGDECYRAVNKDTGINKILTKENICYLDLSRDFLDFPDKVTKDVSVYSIVNSLISLDTVTRVQILIDGEVLSDYAEDGLMDRNYNLIRKEE